jgi:hypothetical protein
MDEIEEIKRLEYELQQKKAALLDKQTNCTHEWTEVKYDPEIVREEYCTGGYEGKGVDRWPRTAYRTIQKDRWSRTCLKCGKVEYAYEKKPVKYEPYFGK